MNNVINKSSTKDELINALIDLFGIREPIEAYKEWLERSPEDLLYIYNCETATHDEYEHFFDDYGDFFHV